MPAHRDLGERQPGTWFTALDKDTEETLKKALKEFGTAFAKKSDKKSSKS